MKPIGQRVLIQEFAQATETKSGIIIPPEQENRTPIRKGEVIKIGDVTKVKVGERVIFQWGDCFDIGADNYYVVNEDNILATW